LPLESRQSLRLIFGSRVALGGWQRPPSRVASLADDSSRLTALE
jgi:hypothetical protein